MACLEDTLKIVVFGLGDIYSKVKHYIYEEKDKIVALIDNNPGLFGTVVDGYMVDNPKHIQNYHYDSVVITSNAALEMKQQLIELGIESDKIIHFLDYIGNIPIEVPVSQIDSMSLSVLILSNDFGYHGGPITCMNLARVLSEKGYNVTIAIPGAEQSFLEGMTLAKSVRVIVVENLDFLSKKNLEWTDKYTYVIANTIVMARCAIKLAESRRVYLWLHESIDTYIGYEYWYDEIENGIKNERLIICAVSDVAKKNFQNIFHIKKEIEILPYGIEDRCNRNDLYAEDEIMTVTVVANHAILKGVDVLFDAFDFISDETIKQCRFLFVGRTYDSKYGKLIREYIERNSNCEYLGELSREKLLEVYSKTDLVIIPSRRDSLPLVAAEAMMLKRPCIISDAIGTMRYMKHKYNGLIFRNENSKELAEMICWCVSHREELKTIAENARKTYEAYFTMEKFGDRIMRVIQCLM